MIWIRADANREIGTGHVMRCLSIAAALKQKGEQVCFLTADEAALPLLQDVCSSDLCFRSESRIIGCCIPITGIRRENWRYWNPSLQEGKKDFSWQTPIM